MFELCLPGTLARIPSHKKKFRAKSQLLIDVRNNFGVDYEAYEDITNITTYESKTFVHLFKNKRFNGPFSHSRF